MEASSGEVSGRVPITCRSVILHGLVMRMFAGRGGFVTPLLYDPAGGGRIGPERGRVANPDCVLLVDPNKFLLSCNESVMSAEGGLKRP